MTAPRIASATAIACVISACGGYSEMIAEEGSEVALPDYTTAIVIDFNAATTPEQELVQQDLAEHRKKVAAAGRRFADLIATQLMADEIYSVVLRQPASADALLITGDITRLVEGHPRDRLLIGMFSGRSRLEGVIRFADNRSSDAIGEMSIDPHSWVLGGLLAAGQTVDDYMEKAAEKVADEIKAVSKE